MLYLFYKTTNLLNGKFYIGIHATNNLHDGYLGSGKLLLKAIRKYGKHNFQRDIIKSYNSLDELIQSEVDMVTEDFCKRDDVYNIMPGGNFGGKNRNGLTFEGRKHSKETKQKLSIKNVGKTMASEAKQKISQNNFSKREPKRQRIHAKYAGKCSWENSRPENVCVHKQKIKESLTEYYQNNPSKNLGLKRNKIQCPHCHKEGSKNCMGRWHFDNCIQKK